MKLEASVLLGLGISGLVSESFCPIVAAFEVLKLWAVRVGDRVYLALEKVEEAPLGKLIPVFWPGLVALGPLP